jgi:outer membrane receptor protein involved in Fe transport
VRLTSVGKAFLISSFSLVAAPALADPGDAPPASQAPQAPATQTPAQQASQAPATPPSAVAQQPAAATDQGEEGSELTIFQLDDVLNTQLTVASEKARTLRESPAVITVVTREEILSSGARDLSEVLQMVPGFGLGVDVEGVVGLGFRGIWGHEGKILLMIDGQQVNETFFGTTQFGEHYPVQAIQSVEIIRGPGSVKYGGSAELAVINVITRTSKDFSGVDVNGDYGQMRGGYARRALTLSYAQDLGEVGISAMGFLGQANRSNSTYTDIYGNTVDLNGNNTMRPGMLNLGAKYRDLHLRFIYDNYRTTEVDGFILTSPKTHKDFISYIAEADYDLKIGKLIITPLLSFHRQLPWRQSDPNLPAYFDQTADRYLARVTAGYDILPNLNGVLGFEGYIDSAWINDTSRAALQRSLQGGTTATSYLNLAGFAEAQYDTFLGNFLAGVRYEQNSLLSNDDTGIRSSVVPRVSYTNVMGPLHFKLLYSNAFKSPLIANLAANESLKPERTTDYEGEVGYRVNQNLFVRANLFDVTINNPIVYYFDPAVSFYSYANNGSIHSRGIEAEARSSFGKHYLNLGYSFAYAGHGSATSTYDIPGHPGLSLGFPGHKLTASGSFVLWKELRLSPTLVFVSERYGYSGDGAGGVQLTNYEARLLANLFLSYTGIVKGLDVGLGGYNLIGAPNYPLIQPYNGRHAPLPSNPREVMLRLTYALPF